MKIKLRPFIKRGLEVFIMMVFVFFLTNTNEFDKSVFDFGKLNKEVGFVAYAVKNEESKPKPVEKNVVFKKKEPVTPKSYETNNSVSVTEEGSYSGSLTGYSADCPACGGRLACINYNVS